MAVIHPRTLKSQGHVDKTLSVDPVALLDELRRRGFTPSEEVPKGWKTREQWQREWNVSTSVAGKALLTGVREGIMETRKFRVETGSRGVYNTPHYRVKANRKK